jgi:hypothetical protein
MITSKSKLPHFDASRDVAVRTLALAAGLNADAAERSVDAIKSFILISSSKQELLL